MSILKERVKEEEFDLVVLSVGLTPSKGANELAQRLSLKLDSYGFCKTDEFSPLQTSQPGIYVCGAFQGPKDIPETVAQASAAVASASTLLADVRGTLTKKKDYPPEIDVTGEEPRIGVFVCHCGINIGGVVNVPGGQGICQNPGRGGLCRRKSLHLLSGHPGEDQEGGPGASTEPGRRRLLFTENP